MNNSKAFPHKTYFIVIFIVFSASLSFGQVVKINSRIIKQTIPNFKEDSVSSFSNRPIVNTKFLPPITSSKADIEIRYYTINSTELLQILRCYPDSIVVEGYKTISVGIPENNKNNIIKRLSESKYIDWIEMKDKRHLFVKNLPKDSYQQNLDWNKLLNDLIKNHLYDIPSGEKLDEIVKTKFPTANFYNSGGVVIELKAGSHYRNINYSTPYTEDQRSAIKELQYLKEILAKVPNLFKPTK